MPRFAALGWSTRHARALAIPLFLVTAAVAQEPLPNTAPLEATGDLASAMVEGVDHFLLAETAASIERRAEHWRRDASSHAAYVASVAKNRERLARYLGVVDPRVAVEDNYFHYPPNTPFGNDKSPAGLTCRAVRWGVTARIEGEGLHLVGDGPAKAFVVAIADSNDSPEAIAGLAPAQFLSNRPPLARTLATAGCEVLVPTLIDRGNAYSRGDHSTVSTNIPHREFIYRQAFEMGRHLLGYEVQKVLAAVDLVLHRRAAAGEKLPIAVVGHGDGGLVAMYAAALDQRIDLCCVMGAFDQREDLWRQPIDRNVFGLLTEFGDAEVASLIAPRALVVEACLMPFAFGRPPVWGNPPYTSAAPGDIETPPLARVRAEFDRALALVEGLSPAPRFLFTASGDGSSPPFCEATSAALGDALGLSLAAPRDSADGIAAEIDPAVAAHQDKRMRRQIGQLVEHTQDLLRESERTRDTFWSKAKRPATPDEWLASVESYRDYFRHEVVGHFDRPLSPPNPRTRKIYDEPTYTGHEVMLDVFPEVFAYGILLVPKDIAPGERRPVVVCQHGLEGRPQDVADPRVDHRAYHRFACQLAERGYITYAPQNPYIFRDRFRSLQRKANPLKKTLFSIIVPQHQQTVAWLAGLPMVDPQRIAFYGLSYGGKTAMRVPPLVDGYCLSICSADFNEWVWKNASSRSSYSYLHRGEYEIFEFDLGSTFNYAEMAALIAPRPFMVERGHRDAVSDDWHVAYEYAKVRLLYADLGIEDRTRLEIFEGPHTIHGVGTFEFLDQHLRWPPKR